MEYMEYMGYMVYGVYGVNRVYRVYGVYGERGITVPCVWRGERSLKGLVGHGLVALPLKELVKEHGLS